MGHRLRRRYGHTARSGAVVTKVRFERNGRFHGVGTRVVLPGGWTMTFIGPMTKSEAVRQAEWHRARGEKSES